MTLEIGQIYDEVTPTMSIEVTRTQIGHFERTDDGKYILVENAPQSKKDAILDEIGHVKALLQNSDYQAIKYAEGELTEEEYAPIREQRKEWRAKIKELESQSIVC